MDAVLRILSGSFTAGEITISTLLFATLLLGARGAWYYGNVYRDMVKDRDDWKSIAISATTTVKDQGGQIEKLTEVTETLTNALGRR